MEARDAIGASRAIGRGGGPSRSLQAPSPRYGEKAIEAMLGLCALLSVVTTTAIVISLLEPSIEFFGQVSLKDFLFGTEWAPTFTPPEFGVLPIVLATMVTSFWGLFVAIPLGLGAAIYLSEYASPRARKTIKPTLEVLAGVPTVAIGFFALFFMRPLLEDLLPFLPWSGPQAAGVAGLAVGLMIVPIIASLSEDAMSAVPTGLREAAYGLGATKMRVATRVVFPAALSGIVASIVLATSRAVGETMIVLLAAGASPNLTLGFTESVQTMTAFIGQTATGDIATGTVTYYTIFAVGLLLFLMTLVLNMISIRLVRRFHEAYD
ncbi:MAG: phosphate ABC transporter permease subunit PstC [Solirubrobacterales bacterium]